MQAKAIEHLEQIVPERPKRAPEHRKGIDICRVGELGCLLAQLCVAPRASSVVPSAPCSTELRLQSFIFHVVDVVICHVLSCIEF